MADIQTLVLNAMRAVNAGRSPEQQLVVSEEAPVFGPDSPLDSLGLVSLLIEIEDLLATEGHSVNLSDAQAMSMSRSPFRNVPALVAFVQRQVEPIACPQDAS